METVRSLPLPPSHSPAAASSPRVPSTMPSSYGQTPSRLPSQPAPGPLPLAHIGRPTGHPAIDGSPYKMRPLPMTAAGTGSNTSGGLTLVPSTHLIQSTSHSLSGGPVTEPVTPPPPPQPQVSHSNLSQVARAHPYAAALPAAPLSGRYNSAQTSLTSASRVYSDSPTYSSSSSRTEPVGGAVSFPLRSPPERSGENKRRLTLLPHSGLSPFDYGGGTVGLSGPGPGGGVRQHHALPSLHSQNAYTTGPVDTYRETLMLPMVSSASAVDHKKLRISGGEPLLMKATLAQPLRIDTRPIVSVAPAPGMPVMMQQHRTESQPAYIPQVEAISPTLPGDGDDPLKRDDSPLRSTKDDLLQQITKVDREISKVENNITKLKKKQQDLEEAAKKPPPEHGELRTTGSRGPKNQSVAQLIYAENRRKAAEAHRTLAPLGPVVDLPLYHQPSDTVVYLRNRTQFLAFRPRLLKFLRRRQNEKESRNRYLTVTYNKWMNEWAKKVTDLEKISNSNNNAASATAPTEVKSGSVPPAAGASAVVPPTSVASGGTGQPGVAAPNATAPIVAVFGKKKEREFYEKVFPELRKQREDRERFSRVGSRIKSDADLEEIMDGLQEQENEDKKMRSLAVVPPVLLDSRERRLCFDNRNGLVEDPMAEYRERPLLNVWTEQEKEIFKEKYLHNPKNFVAAASCLERKSVADCVQFYYLSKKTVNYKQLLRKTKMKRNTRGAMQKPNAAAAAAAAAAARDAAAAAAAAQQREQQLQQQQQANDSGVTTRLQREAQLRPDPVTTSTSNQQTSSSVTVTTTSSISTPSTVTVEAVQSPSDPYSDAAFNDKSSKGEQSASDSAGDSDSEEETILNASNAVGTGGPHPCVVCKAALEHHGQSRPLPKHQASQYGILEADVSAEARVCSACRCRVVRRRYVQCPLPTCPTAKRRVKRLRPLPNKWNELPTEIRTALESEFQIGQDISKCCSTCCNRITRKLAVLTGHSTGISGEGNGSANLGTDKNVSSIRSEDAVMNSGSIERNRERGSSTSSGDDDITMTEKPMVRPELLHYPPQSSHQLLPPRPIPMVVEPRPIVTVPTSAVRIGIPQPPDNSETDSADEGGLGQPIPADNPPPLQPNPVRNGSIGQEALTVRDLVSGVIESQLKKADSHALSAPPGVTGSPIYPPGPSESPTIESILKDSQRNYAVGRNSAPLTVVTNTAAAAPTSGPRPMMMPHPAEAKQPTILILDSSTHPSRRTSPYPQGFIHAGMVPPLQKDIEYNVQEGLAFRMHRDVVPVEGQTLDLSMPKKRDTGGHPPPSAHGSSHGHGGAQSSYAPPPPAHSKTPGKDMHPQQHYLQRNPPQTILLDQPGAGYPPSMRAPYPPRSTPPSQNSNRGPSSGGGSIIQGTPISSAMSQLQVPRTDGLLRPAAISGRDSMSGSITQGTPMVVSKDGAYEAYYKGGPPGRVPDTRMPVSTSYQMDPRLNSQAIMMNDYLLSQQMAERNSGGVRRDREPPMGGGMPPQPQILVSSRASDRSAPPQQPAHPTAMYQYRPPSPMYIQKLPYGPEGHHGYPPHSSGGPQQQLQHPPQQPTPPQQQRQGVIQRNSSVPSIRQDPRPPSAPGGPPHQQHSQSGRTSSPASGQHLLSLGPAGGRPTPVTISPRGDFIHSHDAFTSLVNAAAAQPSLPVPNSDRDRRDVRDIRDREKDVRQLHHGMVARSMHPDRRDESGDRLAPHPYQRESPKMASGPPQPPTSAASNSASASAAGGDCTLTAASLIDAIITHQINQTSNPNESGPSGGSGGPGGPPNSKSVDSLFNQYRRNASPVAEQPRPQLAPSKPDRHPDDPGPPSNPSGPPSQRPPSSSPALAQQQPPPPSTKAAFTLGEHIESIIAKDFHQGSGGGGGPGSGLSEQDREREWQRRRAEAEHFKSRAAAAESSMMNSAAAEFAAKCRAAEQQQSQQQQVQDYSSTASRRDGAESDPRQQQQQPSISPLDYVKKKIVEVMRTNSDGLSGGQLQQQQGSNEMAPPSSPAGRRGPSPSPSPNKRPRLEGDGEQQPPQQQQRGGPSPVVPHYLSSGVPYPTMGYPYTIPPNIPISSAGGSGPTGGHQQPVVVLSSQYEALSDED